MQEIARDLQCRLIISGGYSADASLGQITRPHNDIDIQLYGNVSEAEIIVKSIITAVKKAVPSLNNLEIKDKGRQEYYHSFFIEGNGLGADVYYIQVANDPFEQEKIVVKRDGTHSQSHEYNTTIKTLEGISLEVTDPNFELADILYKRQVRGDVPKPAHDQDIYNLRLITSANTVETLINKM